MERTVLELRKHMSIRAVCGYFHLRWHTVKELEKEAIHEQESSDESRPLTSKRSEFDECSMSVEKERKFRFSDGREGLGIRGGNSCWRTARESTPCRWSSEEVEESADCAVVTMDMANAYSSSGTRKEFPEGAHRFRSLSRGQTDESKNWTKSRRREWSVNWTSTQRKQFKPD